METPASCRCAHVIVFVVVVVVVIEMEYIKYLRGRQRPRCQQSTCKKWQTLVSVLVRQAVRQGVLHANQDMAGCDIFANDSTITDAAAADDLLINSTLIGQQLWSLVQEVLAEHVCELQHAVTLVAMNGSQPNQTDRMRREVSAVVRRLLLLPSQGKRNVTFVLIIIAFSSVLAQTISTTHGIGVISDIVCTIESDLHKVMQESEGAQQKQQQRLRLSMIGLLGVAFLSLYALRC